MVASERPQERLAKHGAEALSDSEILAMILRSGPRGIDVLTMSSDLLKPQAHSLTYCAGRPQTSKRLRDRHR